MPNEVLSFGTESYAVVTSTTHGYAYMVRLCDQAVTHLSAVSPGHDEARALYRIYEQDPDQFETICHRQSYYPAPKWRMN